MKARLFLALALSLTLGCQFQTPTTTSGLKRPPASRNVATPASSPVPFNDPTRVVDLDTAELISKVKLVGKVKLISDKGLGIISNNTGGLISDKGLGLVSNNGGGLISDRGLGYRVQAADARQESLLAEAQIEVLDAAGHVLVDGEGQPITGFTDKEGNYQFEATLPRENLILRVRLFPNEGGSAGHLYAFLTNATPDAGEREVAIDTASSLGTAYVLSEYVKQSQQVLDKLPRSEAEALRKDMEAARALLGQAEPSYQPDALAKATRDLRAKDKALDTRLETIEAILLAGQANLGNGLLATQVGLSMPRSVVGDGKGNLYISEMAAGRIRKVDAAGRISRVTESDLGFPAGILVEPDGGILAAEHLAARVRRIGPDGKVTAVVGTGVEAVGALGAPATQITLKRPMSLAKGPDGALYVSEVINGQSGGAGRIIKVAPDGTTSALPALPQGSEKDMEPASLAIGKDGVVHVLSDRGQIFKLEDGAWRTIVSGLDNNEHGAITLAADGTLYMSENNGHRIERFAPDGTRTTYAGTGQGGYAGDGGPATAAQLNQPSGMWLAPDGTLYVTELGNAVVRAIAPDGTIKTVAGTQGLTQQGDALAIAINSPGGAAIDAQGRLVVVEAATHTIKRLDGRQLVVIAGTTSGDAGDGGQALAAQFNVPAGVAYAGETLYVIESGGLRLRRIGPDGLVSTAAGNGERGDAPFSPENGFRAPAASKCFRRPMAIAVGPDGRPVWTDNENHQVLRLVSDTEVELVAGSGREGFEGDGGPATAAKLYGPTGVAIDSKGNVYVADAANLVVRKIAPDGVISTFAGIPIAKAALKLLTYKPGSDDGAAATEALLLGPVSLVVDADDNLYIAEVGSTNLAIAPSLPEGIPLDLIPKIGGRIRKVTADGKIHTIAGAGTPLLADESGDNLIKLPTSLAFDGEGRLIIVDGALNQIKLLPKGAF